MKNRLYPLVICLLIVSCATTYQPVSWTGGFNETQLDENVWRIDFGGNAYTSMQRSIDFTLLRSAELTMEQGYQYFVIVDVSQSTVTQSTTLPSTTNTTGTISDYGTGSYNLSATSYTSGGQTIVMNKPRTSNTIVMFVTKPKINGLVYTAEFLINSLKEKYGLLENSL